MSGEGLLKDGPKFGKEEQLEDPTIQRLLGDLSSEFARLAEQVKALTCEGDKLKKENVILKESLQPQKDSPATAKGSHEASGNKIDPVLREATTVTTPELSDVPRSVSIEWTESLSFREMVTPALSNWTSERDMQHTQSERGERPSCNRAQDGCKGPTTEATKVVCAAGDDELNSQGSLNSMTSEDMLLQEKLERYKSQFGRLDRCSKGFLTANDCWHVVSHVESQKYGHIVHDYKRIVRAIKMVNYLKRQANAGNRTSCVVLSNRASLASDNSNEFLDFETFCFLMDSMQPGSSEPRSSTVEEEEQERIVREHTRVFGGMPVVGDDSSFLRKAFQQEATEHFAKLARQNIAQKRAENKDPAPKGCLHKALLETIPPLIISANALEIGLQADIKTPVWHWVERIFVAFYVTEFVLKLRLLGCNRFFRGQEGRWNTFDFCCLISTGFDAMLEVIAALISLDGLPILVPMLKVARLARLARIVRSFRYKVFEDLKSMVSGVFSGARVLGWSIVLLFMVVYMLGVFMKQVLGTQFTEFRNVPSAMFTVFRCFTDGCTNYDGQPLQERVRARLEEQGFGGIFMVLYILMFLVVTVGVFNLIMAIFIDNVVTTSMKRKQHELGAREDEMKVSVEEMLIHLFRGTMGVRGSRVGNVGKISRQATKQHDLEDRSKWAAEGMAYLRSARVLVTRDLFNAWLTDPEMLALLDDMEIDTATKFEIFDVCDVDKSGSLTPDELVSGLMRLRGPISKCDIIAMRLKVRYLTDMLEDIHHSLGA